MSKALFTVRAVVSDASKRAAFDDWYRKEHLPQAIEAFGAEKAWRTWSEIDPSVHSATYQFSDRSALDRGTTGEPMKVLVAEFDRVWPGVTRTREVARLVEGSGG